MAFMMKLFGMTKKEETKNELKAPAKTLSLSKKEKEVKKGTTEQEALLKELASYEESLHVRPNDAVTLFNRGLVLSYLDRPQEALDSYDRSLRVRPEHADTLHGRGIVLTTLIEGLQRNDPSLTSLNLGSWALNAEQCQALFAALQHNTFLTSLETSGLDEDEKKTLAERLARNRRRPEAEAKTVPGEAKTEMKLVEPPAKKSVAPNSFCIPFSELTVGAELGRGGFGVIYQGFLFLHTPVAIKQALDGLSEEEADFIKESAALMQLHSPFVVQFYGYCETPRYTLVMEYMPMGSLNKLLKEANLIGIRIGVFGCRLPEI